MKTSELVKLLRKTKKSYLTEHGKEHDKWHSEITGKDFRVPRHPAKEITPGTLDKIMKDAGLK